MKRTGTSIRYAFLASAVMGVSAFGINAHAQSQAGTYKPLSKAERLICKDLDMCVDLLLRHDASQFDYAALSADFQRFGGQGLGKLLGIIASGKNPDRQKSAQNAQDILLQANWSFPPAAQTQIAQIWPSADPARHMRLMANIGTAQMRGRAIETLGANDARVREQSRALLAALARKNLAAPLPPLPPAAFADLAKAARAQPTPEIIALIGSFPAAQARPVLGQYLTAPQPAISGAAYRAIFAYGPDMALSDFRAALKTIKSPAQVLAVSDMLQARNRARMAADGKPFYLELAYGLLTDRALPPPARIAALDMILNSAPLSGRAIPKADDITGLFKTHITQTGAPLGGYMDGFALKAGENTGVFLPLIWDEILKRESGPAAQGGEQRGEDEKLRVTDLAAKLVQTPKWRAAALPILRRALADNKDWRIQRSAALALGKAQDKPSAPVLTRLASEAPILPVRAAARSSLTGIKGGKINAAQDMKAVFAAAKSCPVDGFDFVDDAKQLPFFESGKIKSRDNGANIGAARRFLRTAYPSKSGWLAGYDMGARGGGLLYYDNQSGDYQKLSDEAIIAATPVTPTPLGTFASQFWIVDGESISHLKVEGGAASLQQHLHLPATPSAIHILPDQSLQIGFTASDALFSFGQHPPLRLLPNGRLVSGCMPLPSGAPRSLPN